MSHLTVKLAHNIIKHQEQYSGCVVQHAKSIVDWDAKRKNLTQKLWSHYRKIFSQVAVEAKNSFGINKSKIIRKVLSEHLDRDLHNDFHMCKNALRSHKDMVLSFGIFKASVRASDCENVMMMHRYMSCVNAMQKDESVGEVGFLRWISGTELSEIILFKLLQSQKSKN